MGGQCVRLGADRGFGALVGAATSLGCQGPVESRITHAGSYLGWAFERLGTHRDRFDLPLQALTPAAFKKALG